MSQLSLFGAAAREPQLHDLAALLAGPGAVVRRGTTARISVVLDADRGEVLADELEARFAMRPETVPQDGSEDTFSIRTPWLPELLPLASAWTQGAVTRPPAAWSLDGAALRWWCIAGGVAGPGVYSLALGTADDLSWRRVAAALAGAGVAGVRVGPRAGGPAVRVAGQRRLTRLAELVGPRPLQMPPGSWPQDEWTPTDPMTGDPMTDDRELRGDQH